MPVRALRQSLEHVPLTAMPRMLKTMNAREGIKTRSLISRITICSLLKTMNAREGIKTIDPEVRGGFVDAVKNNECP